MCLHVSPTSADCFLCSPAAAFSSFFHFPPVTTSPSRPHFQKSPCVCCRSAHPSDQCRPFLYVTPPRLCVYREQVLFSSRLMSHKQPGLLQLSAGCVTACATGSSSISHVGGRATSLSANMNCPSALVRALCRPLPRASRFLQSFLGFLCFFSHASPLALVTV